MAEIIGVKELYKNLKDIAKKTAKGESFIVVNRSKPIFKISPHDEKKYVSKTSLWEDFKDMQFSSLPSGHTNLSEHVDEIVYGL